MTINIDVAIVGGGVLGLWLLNDLHARKYSAILITNTPLGVGQTLHSHVYLHKGFLYSDASWATELLGVHSVWDAFIQQRGLRRLQTQAYWLFSQNEIEYREAQWQFGQGHFARGQLPPAFGNGRYAAKLSYVTDEVCLDGEELVRKLSEPVQHLILHGEVTHLSPKAKRLFASSAGQTLKFVPRHFVFCAGAGNHGLLMDAAETDETLASLISSSPPQRIRLSQMVVLKGKHLANLACIFRETDLFMASRPEDEETVWLVSVGVDQESRGHEHRLHDPPVEVARMRKTFKVVRDLAPQIFTADLQQSAQFFGGLLRSFGSNGGHGISVFGAGWAGLCSTHS